MSRDGSVKGIVARDIGHEHLIVISYRLHLHDVHGCHLRDACRLAGPTLRFLEWIWRLIQVWLIACVLQVADIMATCDEVLQLVVVELCCVVAIVQGYLVRKRCTRRVEQGYSTLVGQGSLDWVDWAKLHERVVVWMHLVMGGRWDHIPLVVVIAEAWKLLMHGSCHVWLIVERHTILERMLVSWKTFFQLICFDIWDRDLVHWPFQTIIQGEDSLISEAFQCLVLRDAYLIGLRVVWRMIEVIIVLEGRSVVNAVQKVSSIVTYVLNHLQIFVERLLILIWTRFF